MRETREHPRSDPVAARQRRFTTKLVAAVAVTIVAAYVTATLL